MMPRSSPLTSKRRWMPPNSSRAWAAVATGCRARRPTAMAASAFSAWCRPGMRRRTVPRRSPSLPDVEDRLEAVDTQLARLPVGVGRSAVGDEALAHVRQQRAHVDVVDAEDRQTVERHPVHELQVRRAHLLHVAVVVEVLGVDVGDHRDDRRQHQEGAVALVGLGDQDTRPGRAGRWCRARAACRRRRRSDRGPPRAGSWRASDVVVVLPCVPATAMPYFMRISSASISARGMTGILSSRARTTSGFANATADEMTTTSTPSSTWAASCGRR